MILPEKVALAMLDGFADPSASVITAIGIVTNVIVLSVIFFFQYKKNRSPISVSRSTSRDGKSQQQLQLHELPPLQQQQQQQQNQPQPHQELLRQQYSNQSTRSVEPRRKWASAYITVGRPFSLPQRALLGQKWRNKKRQT